MVLYEKRFGNFNDIRDPESDAFIQAVNDMFITTGTVAFTPPAIAKIFFRKDYDRHWNSWDLIMSRGTVFSILSESLLSEPLRYYPVKPKHLQRILLCVVCMEDNTVTL